MEHRQETRTTYETRAFKVNRCRSCDGTHSSLQPNAVVKKECGPTVRTGCASYAQEPHTESCWGYNRAPAPTVMPGTQVAVQELREL